MTIQSKSPCGKPRHKKQKLIPFAGIASWYEYTNSQGAPLYNEADYAHTLAAYNSGAAFLDNDWTVINDDYASFLWQLAEDQQATNGNYDEIPFNQIVVHNAQETPSGESTDTPAV